MNVSRSQATPDSIDLLGLPAAKTAVVGGLSKLLHRPIYAAPGQVSKPDKSVKPYKNDDHDC
jgi:hypothetical protein